MTRLVLNHSNMKTINTGYTNTKREIKPSYQTIYNMYKVTNGAPMGKRSCFSMAHVMLLIVNINLVYRTFHSMMY